MLVFPIIFVGVLLPAGGLPKKNALSHLHRLIAQATIQNTNTTKRDYL